MSELIVSRQQQVLLLTLNRPAARNALNNALLTQLVNELEAAATEPPRKSWRLNSLRKR